jgi:serine/threonine protein kinase
MKPSNVVITPDDQARVLDLGLALIQGEICGDRTIVGGQGYVVGTMDYLAPEQAEDAFNVDSRVDIYSLGCTLYFALTKQPPYPGGNALQKLLRHRIDEPTPIAQLNPGVPAEFIALVAKMMAKQKEQRFGSASEVRAALAPFAGIDEPAPARAASPKLPPKVEAVPEHLMDRTEPSPAPWFVGQQGAEPSSKEKRPVAVDAPTPKPAALISTEPPANDGPSDPPQAIPLSPELAERLAPQVAVAEAAPGQPSKEETPFWFDYLLPVGAGSLFLFVVWLIGFIALLRR